jgi:hypothetical protein
MVLKEMLKKYAAIVSTGLIWLTAMNLVTKDSEISWQAEQLSSTEGPCFLHLGINQLQTDPQLQKHRSLL